MQAKMIMLLTSVILTIGVGTSVLADPPEPCTDCGDGRGILLPLWWLRPIPSDTGHYIGYYVGGGNGRPHKAEPRRDDEGTWGWDYQGWIIRRRVVLGWWHGQRYQGGTGAYRTDGPHLYHPEAEER